jgi:hypothetical protein
LRLLTRHIIDFAADCFSTDAFFGVGFSHHSEILAKEKSLDGRLFYIAKCAAEFWTVDTLESYLRSDLFVKTSAMPSISASTKRMDNNGNEKDSILSCMTWIEGLKLVRANLGVNT